MNETSLPFDDLAIFLCVAEAGSLSAAARQLDIPLPTLSRRMARMEAESKRDLFLRGKNGYSLSADGRALAAQLSGLHDIRRSVTAWQRAGRENVPVRITAGALTTRHLIRALADQMADQKAGQPRLWQPRFVAANANLDIARREVDIGIRRAPPDTPWLARRPLRDIHYAVYAVTPDITGFVSLSEGTLPTASQKWLQDTHGDQITATASDMRLCLDLARAGFGRIILPEFVGQGEADLVQVADRIEGLSHQEWLVCHQDDRHQPAIRAALETIAGLLT